MSSILTLAVTALGQSDAVTTQSVDPGTSVSSPAMTIPPDPNFPFGTGPQSSYHFLSPSLNYYPPDGAWKTSMLSAFANTTGNTSVSLQTVASGVTFRHANSNVTLLVNGSTPESLNGTTQINEANATVSGLAQGWYNFTLVANGTAVIHGVIPNTEESRWLPAIPGPATKVNTTTPLDLFTTSGAWSGEHYLTTNSTGASLVIRPPAGTALLELVQDMPLAPFGAFNISVSPEPPLQPANQSLSGTIFTADIVAAIGILNALAWRVELDPLVHYSVNVTYVGNGTLPFNLYSIGTYRSLAGPVNGTMDTSAVKPGTETGSAVGIGAGATWLVLLASVFATILFTFIF